MRQGHPTILIVLREGTPIATLLPTNPVTRIDRQERKRREESIHLSVIDLQTQDLQIQAVRTVLIKARPRAKDIHQVPGGPVHQAEAILLTGQTGEVTARQGGVLRAAVKVTRQAEVAHRAEVIPQVEEVRRVEVIRRVEAVLQAEVVHLQVEVLQEVALLQAGVPQVAEAADQDHQVVLEEEITRDLNRQDS